MKERILRHLMDFGSITSWEAIMDYGCTRLSQYIYLLKKEGYSFEYETIKSKNRYGEPNHCKRYILIEEFPIAGPRGGLGNECRSIGCR